MLASVDRAGRHAHARAVPDTPTHAESPKSAPAAAVQRPGRVLPLLLSVTPGPALSLPSRCPRPRPPFQVPSGLLPDCTPPGLSPHGVAPPRDLSCCCPAPRTLSSPPGLRHFALGPGASSCPPHPPGSCTPSNSDPRLDTLSILLATLVLLCVRIPPHWGRMLRLQPSQSLPWSHARPSRPSRRPAAPQPQGHPRAQLSLRRGSQCRPAPRSSMAPSVQRGHLPGSSQPRGFRPELMGKRRVLKKRRRPPKML